MSTSDQGQVAAAAAVVYEEFFVPALFGQFAGPMIDVAGVQAGDRVLDVGCGTGIVARTALERVGPTGSVVGVDLNVGMLDVAAQHSDSVEWREGAAENLPFASDSFDAATCQFALMFFSDRAKSLREIARVVRPGGPVVVSTWAEVTSSPGYAAMIKLLGSEIGADAAKALQAPFQIGMPEQLSELMSDTFGDVSVTAQRGMARFASLDEWLYTDIRGWTLSNMVDDEQFEAFARTARTELAEFVSEDGSVEFAAPALIATCTA